MKSQYDTPPLLVTMREVEQLLNLDDNSIYKLVAAGELTALHLGRALRIEYQSIIDLIERRKQVYGQRTK
jgi:excisionase family DNA binding protein